MRLEPLVCPNCSSPVDANASTQIVQCRSCGSQSRMKEEQHYKPVNCSTDGPNQQSIEKIEKLLSLAGLQLSNGSFSAAHETCQNILQIEPGVPHSWALSAVCKAQMARTEATERIEN